MNNKPLPSNEISVKKGRRLIPVLCNMAGTLILLAVIAFCLPITLAKIRGYEVYNVVSGSMEPAIPVGSVLYVEQVEPEEDRKSVV